MFEITEGARIVFLDCDGVVNNQSTRLISLDGKNRVDPVDENLVNGVIRAIDEVDAEIVISSTWRKYYPVQKIIAMLGNHDPDIKDILHKRIEKNIWRTPDTSSGFRGREISKWISEYEICVGPVCRYAIIDDDTDFSAGQLPHFVNTDAEFGWRPRDRDTLIQAMSVPLYLPAS